MIKILIGLVALGVVILVHELGHFFAARLAGVEVETFSIGWGPVLFRKKGAKTEWRISLLPIGGYCGMKGEHAFADAVQKNLAAIPAEKGSFFGAHPLRRIFISCAGPFANLLFAALVFALVSAIGTSYRTYGNRIVPVSAYERTASNPSDRAGLAEGDRIVSVGKKSITNFTELQQAVGTHPGETLDLEYERDGVVHTTSIVPDLDRKTGAGRIGVYPFVPLKVGSVQPGSAAETTGIRAGDVITAVDGTPVAHYIAFEHSLESRPAQVTVTVDRLGAIMSFPLVILYDDKTGVETGISWETVDVTVRGTGPVDSLRIGCVRTWETIVLTVRGIGLLFRGIDLTEAVSGPVRITLMIGEVAKTGLASLAEFLGIICVSLCIMNLLPIPVLDGGQVLIAVLELLNGRPLKPKTLYYIQFAGMAVIMGIFLFAIFGDIRFLTK